MTDTNVVNGVGGARDEDGTRGPSGVHDCIPVHRGASEDLVQVTERAPRRMREAVRPREVHGQVQHLMFSGRDERTPAVDLYGTRATPDRLRRKMDGVRLTERRVQLQRDARPQRVE